MKRQLTAEQTKARDERRASFRKLCKTIADMGESERLALAAKIGVVTCEGHELSFHNQCLLALQMPQASVVGGFRQWIKAGRAVQKGQHGAMIWVPIGGKKSEPGTTPDASNGEPDDTRFIMATIFDVSQTAEIETGKPETAELIAA